MTTCNIIFSPCFLLLFFNLHFEVVKTTMKKRYLCTLQKKKKEIQRLYFPLLQENYKPKILFTKKMLLRWNFFIVFKDNNLLKKVTFTLTSQLKLLKKNQLGQQPLFFNGVQSPTYDFLTSQWCKSNAYSGATVSEYHTTILVFTFKDGVW